MIFTNKKAMNPVIKYFQLCFEIENLFLITKITSRTGTNRIPFSLVKKAKDEIVKARTM
jgi:hypothetical protein